MSIAKVFIDIDVNTQRGQQQIAGLQRSLTTLNSITSTLNKNIHSQSSIANRLSNDLVNLSNSTGYWESSLIRTRTAASRLDESLRKGQVTMGQFFSARFRADSMEAASVLSLANQRVAALGTQFVGVTRSADGFRESIAMRPMEAFNSANAVATERLAIHRAMLHQATTSMINFGKNTQWAGRQLMVGFTVPLAIFGASAMRTFKEIEMAGVRFKKVYGDIFTPPEEMEQNAENMQELAKEFTKYGIAVKDTLNLAAEAAAAGARNANLTDAVTQATRLATLGQMEQNEALETTTALQNAFRLSGQELADAVNYLNMVENQTVVTLQDLAQAIPRVAPVIVGLGGNVRDLSAFMAAMQEGGVSAAQGANALKSGLGSLINPTEKASKSLAAMGININQIVSANRGDLMATVQAFGAALDTVSEFERQQALEELFGKYQYARLGALFANINKEGTQAARAIELANYSTQELAASAEKELSVITDAYSVQLAGAMERFKLAIAPIGEMFTKFLIPIVNFATKIAEAFNNLPEPIKNITAIGTVLIGIVIPAGTMFLGLLMNLIGTLTKFSSIVAIAFRGFMSGGIGGAMTAVSQALRYMSLEEINAANSAQQLGSATANANNALRMQVGSAGSAQVALQRLKATIDAVTASYMNAAQASFTANSRMGSPYGPGLRAASLARGLNPLAAAPPGARVLPIIRRNTGDIVPGTGNTDTVPAMLTPGEFVVNKQATANNLETLQAINSGQQVQYRNKGGMIAGVQYFGPPFNNPGGGLVRLVPSFKKSTSLVSGLRKPVPGGHGASTRKPYESDAIPYATMERQNMYRSGGEFWRQAQLSGILPSATIFSGTNRRLQNKVVGHIYSRQFYSRHGGASSTRSAPRKPFRDFAQLRLIMGKGELDSEQEYDLLANQFVFLDKKWNSRVARGAKRDDWEVDIVPSDMISLLHLLMSRGMHEHDALIVAGVAASRINQRIRSINPNQTIDERLFGEIVTGSTIQALRSKTARHVARRLNPLAVPPPGATILPIQPLNKGGYINSFGKNISKYSQGGGVVSPGRFYYGPKPFFSSLGSGRRQPVLPLMPKGYEDETGWANTIQRYIESPPITTSSAARGSRSLPTSSGITLHKTHTSSRRTVLSDEEAMILEKILLDRQQKNQPENQQIRFLLEVHKASRAIGRPSPVQSVDDAWILLNKDFNLGLRGEGSPVESLLRHLEYTPSGLVTLGPGFGDIPAEGFLGRLVNEFRRTDQYPTGTMVSDYGINQSRTFESMLMSALGEDYSKITRNLAGVYTFSKEKTFSMLEDKELIESLKKMGWSLEADVPSGGVILNPITVNRSDNSILNDPSRNPIPFSSFGALKWPPRDKLEVARRIQGLNNGGILKSFKTNNKNMSGFAPGGMVNKNRNFYGIRPNPSLLGKPSPLDKYLVDDYAGYNPYAVIQERLQKNKEKTAELLKTSRGALTRWVGASEETIAKFRTQGTLEAAGVFSPLSRTVSVARGLLKPREIVESLRVGDIVRTPSGGTSFTAINSESSSERVASQVLQHAANDPAMREATAAGQNLGLDIKFLKDIIREARSVFKDRQGNPININQSTDEQIQDMLSYMPAETKSSYRSVSKDPEQIKYPSWVQRDSNGYPTGLGAYAIDMRDKIRYHHKDIAGRRKSISASLRGNREVVLRTDLPEGTSAAVVSDFLLPQEQRAFGSQVSHEKETILGPEEMFFKITGIEEIMVPAQPIYPSQRQIDLEVKRRKNIKLSEEEQKELDRLQQEHLAPTEEEKKYPNRYASRTRIVNGEPRKEVLIRTVQYTVEPVTDPKSIKELQASRANIPVFNQGGIVKNKRIKRFNDGGSLVADALGITTGPTYDSSYNSNPIVPGVGNTDTVPAMLTAGEFVVNKEATSENIDVLNAINSGQVVGANKGGYISAYGEGGRQYTQTRVDPKIGNRTRSKKEVASTYGVDPKSIRSAGGFFILPSNARQGREISAKTDRIDELSGSTKRMSRKNWEAMNFWNNRPKVVGDLTVDVPFSKLSPDQVRSVISQMDRSRTPFGKTYDYAGGAISVVPYASNAGGRIMAANKGSRPSRIPITQSIERKFASGNVFDASRSSIVPGAGNTDTVASVVPAGAFVINKKSTNKYRNTLEKINSGKSIIGARKGFKIPRFSDGAQVPAMLTPGEYIIDKENVDSNLSLLHQINNGTLAVNKGGYIDAFGKGGRQKPRKKENKKTRGSQGRSGNPQKRAENIAKVRPVSQSGMSKFVDQVHSRAAMAHSAAISRLSEVVNRTGESLNKFGNAAKQSTSTISQLSRRFSTIPSPTVPIQSLISRTQQQRTPLSHEQRAASSGFYRYMRGVDAEGRNVPAGMRGMGASMVGMTAGMGVMMMGQQMQQKAMQKGEESNIGALLSNFGLGISVILPILAMMKGALAAPIAGLLLLGTGIYGIAKGFSNLKNSVVNYNKALMGSTKATEDMAKAMGRQTNAQIVAIRDVEIASGQRVTEESFQASQKFMESDAAKNLVKDLILVKKVGGDVSEAMSNQMKRAILAGALTPQEASLISAQIGQQIGEKTLGAEVTANINTVIGPDGKKLSGNRLDIASKLTEMPSLKEMNDQFDKTLKQSMAIEKIWKGEFWVAQSARFGLISQEDVQLSAQYRTIINSINESYAIERDLRAAVRLEYEQGTLSVDEYILKLKELNALNLSGTSFETGVKTATEAFNAAKGTNYSEEQFVAAADLQPAISPGARIARARGAQNPAEEASQEFFNAMNKQTDQFLKQSGREMEIESLKALSKDIMPTVAEQSQLYQSMAMGQLDADFVEKFKGINITSLLSEDESQIEYMTRLNAELEIFAAFPELKEVMFDVAVSDPEKFEQYQKTFLEASKLPDDIKKTFNLDLSTKGGLDNAEELLPGLKELEPYLNQLQGEERQLALNLAVGENGEPISPAQFIKNTAKIRKVLEDLESTKPETRLNAMIEYATMFRDAEGNKLDNPEEVVNNLVKKYGAKKIHNLPTEIFKQVISVETEIQGLEERISILRLEIAMASRAGVDTSALRAELDAALEALGTKKATVDALITTAPKSKKTGGGGETTLMQDLNKMLKDAQKWLKAMKDFLNKSNPDYKKFIAGPYAPEFLEYLSSQGDKAQKLIKQGNDAIMKAYRKFEEVQLTQMTSNAVMARAINPILVERQRSVLKQDLELSGRTGMTSRRMEAVRSLVGEEQYDAAARIRAISKKERTDDQKQALREFEKTQRQAIRLSRRQVVIEDRGNIRGSLVEERENLQSLNLLSQRGLSPQMQQDILELGYSLDTLKNKKILTLIQDQLIRKQLQEVQDKIKETSDEFSKLRYITSQGIDSRMAEQINGLGLSMEALQKISKDGLTKLKNYFDLSQTFKGLTEGKNQLLDIADSIKTTTILSTDFKIVNPDTISFISNLKLPVDKLKENKAAVEELAKAYERLSIQQRRAAYEARDPLVKEGEILDLRVRTMQQTISTYARNIIKPLEDSLTEIGERISAKQREIELMERTKEPYQDAIDALEKEKEALQEVHDKRIKALEKIERINERIARQQRAQLSVASALSRGDIAGAAQAALEMQQQEASERASDARQALEDQNAKEMAAKDELIKQNRDAIEAIDKNIKAINLEIRSIQDEQYNKQQELNDAKKEQLKLEEKLYKLQLLQTINQVQQAMLESIRMGDVEAVKLYQEQLKSLLSIAGGSREEQESFFGDEGKGVINSIYNMGFIGKTPEDLIREEKQKDIDPEKINEQLKKFEDALKNTSDAIGSIDIDGILNTQVTAIGNALNTLTGAFSSAANSISAYQGGKIIYGSGGGKGKKNVSKDEEPVEGAPITLDEDNTKIVQTVIGQGLGILGSVLGKQLSQQEGALNLSGILNQFLSGMNTQFTTFLGTGGGGAASSPQAGAGADTGAAGPEAAPGGAATTLSGVLSNFASGFQTSLNKFITEGNAISIIGSLNKFATNLQTTLDTTTLPLFTGAFTNVITAISTFGTTATNLATEIGTNVSSYLTEIETIGKRMIGDIEAAGAAALGAINTARQQAVDAIASMVPTAGSNQPYDIDSTMSHYGGFVGMAFGGKVSYKGSRERAPGMAFGGRVSYKGSRERAPGMANGGIAGQYVPGTGMIDKVPALLTPGEFVVRKSVAKEYGPLLENLNGQLYPNIGRNLSTPKATPVSTRVMDNQPQTLVVNNVQPQSDSLGINRSAFPRQSIPMQITSLPDLPSSPRMSINLPMPQSAPAMPVFPPLNIQIPMAMPTFPRMDSPEPVIMSNTNNNANFYNQNNSSYYGINVNSSGNSSAEEIANVVVRKIRAIDDRKIKGVRM